MEIFNAIAIIVTISAISGYLNHRFIGLPKTIALMIMSIILSFGLMALEGFFPLLNLTAFLAGIDFNETLLVGMLSFLLFAGALHVDLNDLIDNGLEIGLFATLGVLISTAIVGTVFYCIFDLTGFDLPYIKCLLFGALISPTDPIAVLGILKRMKASRDLEVKIAGESLFNDGVGVVLFVILSTAVLEGGKQISAGKIAVLFVEEVAGGLLLGLIIGWIAFVLMRSIDNYQLEILITLALVTGGYALALQLHISGPIAVVVAGLMTGNQGRRLAMSEITRNNLDTFWELVDDILNTVLFVLIGLEVMSITFDFNFILMGLTAIPVVLFARFCAVGTPVMLLKKFKTFIPDAVKFLTWGGLKGGISVALALSLPPGPVRDLFLTMTYLVVIFSLVVQGLSVKSLIKKLRVS